MKPPRKKDERGPTGDAAKSRWDVDTIWEQFRRGIEDPEFRKFFNRDPERTVPAGEHLVVSPADGQIAEVVQGAEGTSFTIKIGYLDVHVQRAPFSGRVMRIVYSGSGHIKTGDPRHVRNFRATLEIESAHGEYKLHMITGFSVRRLLVFVDPEDLVDTGDRVGRILFGSTAILELPPGARPVAKEGDQVYGAESVLAELGP